MRRTRKSPFEIVLDIDATDFALHGTQEQRFDHGDYRESCSLPVLMCVDRHPVLVRLRTAAKDAAFGIREELSGVIAVDPRQVADDAHHRAHRLRFLPRRHHDGHRA